MTVSGVAIGGTAEDTHMWHVRGPGRRRMLPEWSRRWAEPASVAILASVLFVVGFGGGRWRMTVPLGGGDLLPAYATARFWAQGAPFGNAWLGYPFGAEQRYYPTADVLTDAVAGLVTHLTGNPFLGLNAMYALSFPATALAALWVFRIAGLRGRWTVLAVLALDFIPWHWYRFEHVYLATMYSAVLGVGLALLVATGRVEERLRSALRLRFALTLVVVAALVATGGIYYAVFTVLLCAAAVVWRMARGAGWRDLLLATVPAVTVGLLLVLVLAPDVLYQRANPPILPVAQRGVAESVIYAGALVFALLPAPVSRLPGAGLLNAFSQHAMAALKDYPRSEIELTSNYGSIATVIALLIFAIGGMLRVRRAAVRDPSSPDHVSRRPAPAVGLPLIGFLIAVSLLFFVPWGLNYLFAFVVSPEIRGWNRLLPVMFTLVFLGAGLVAREWKVRLRPVAEAAVLCLAVLVLLFDSVFPARVFFTAAAATGSPFSDAGYAYARDLNAAVPGRCGVLELPYIPYPETPPKVDMGNYEPLWPAVTNPEKAWSGSAMKGTIASAWQARVGDAIEQGDIPMLEAGGFCAVHVDKRGYSPVEAQEVTDQLTGLLGRPVATGLGGKWVAFALPDRAPHPLDAQDLAKAPGGVGTFYAPPQIQPGAGAPAQPVWSLFHTTWWLPAGAAQFQVAALRGGAAFTSVTGQLQAGSCGAQDVTITLAAPSGRSRQVVHVPAGSTADFAVRLTHAARSARVTVATSAGPCVPSAQPLPGVIALLDPRGVN